MFAFAFLINVSAEPFFLFLQNVMFLVVVILDEEILPVLFLRFVISYWKSEFSLKPHSIL